MDGVLDDDNRRLQPVKIDIVGVETGDQRYKRDKHEDSWRPAVAAWRNGLTACSQRYNLYFVAHNNWVQIYQPSLPSYRLGRTPAMGIVPDEARSDASGYIDPDRPSNINHLIVGDLGSEEILLVATDNGNVAAYYTKTIKAGIDRKPYRFSNLGRSDLVAVRAFFTYWVQESAWGLSIHKEARMIAVSANRAFNVPTGRTEASITVFAFALTNAGSTHSEDFDLTDEDLDDSSGWSDWPPDPHKLPDRSLNWRTKIYAHNFNIPNISFVNSAEDREGKYLLSTSLYGETTLWHIWREQRIYNWDFSSRTAIWPIVPSMRYKYVGWNVLPLDPRSFQVVSTMEEFCGQQSPQEQAHGPLDICSGLEYVPGHDRSVEWEESDAEAELMDDVTSTQTTLNASPNEARIWANTVHHSRPEDDEMTDGSLLEPRPADTDESDEEIHPISNFGLNVENHPFLRHGDIIVSSISGAVGGFQARRALEPEMAVPDRDDSSSQLASRLPCMPAIHLSASHLRLFDASSSAPASVVCSDILKFQDPMYYQEERSIDRLNMAQHIPELGVVVLATQIGRVAVCSLTRLGAEGPFGIRVDWILPFRHQEESNERPQARLLGIAASPVPGHQVPASGSTTESDDEGASQTWLKNRVDREGGFISFDPNIVRPKKKSTSDNRAPTIETKKTEPKRRRKPPAGRKSKPRSKPAPSSASISPPTPITQTSSIQNYDLHPLPWPSHPSHPSVPSQTTAGPQNLAPNPSSPSSSPPNLTINDIPTPWQGIEYSRRYRLMLTYADHTVMTYELSRMRPFVGDPAGGNRRKNWKNSEG